MAIIHASGTRPRTDPILYLEGGPGGSALADPDYWLESLLHTSRDIILLDQRGTGFSLPSLDCPETDAYSNEEDSGYDSMVAAAAACRDRLALVGVDLTQYNSANSAADVEDLRLALGIDQWNLYGVSYGTRLALTVMRDFPAGVRAVVLDSVYPPNVKGYTEDPVNSIAAIEKLVTGCAGDEECAGAFPNLKRRFYRVVADLNKTPVAVGDYTYTGDDLVNFLFNSLYDTTLIPYLPLVIYAASEGSYDPWVKLDEYANGAAYNHDSGGEKAGQPGADDEPPANDADSQGMFYSVECNESVIFSDYDKAAALVGDYPKSVTAGLLESLEETFAVCAIWGAGEADAIESQAVHSDYPDLSNGRRVRPRHARPLVQARASHAAQQLLCRDAPRRPRRHLCRPMRRTRRPCLLQPPRQAPRHQLPGGRVLPVRLRRSRAARTALDPRRTCVARPQSRVARTPRAGMGHAHVPVIPKTHTLCPYLQTSALLSVH